MIAALSSDPQKALHLPMYKAVLDPNDSPLTHYSYTDRLEATHKYTFTHLHKQIMNSIIGHINVLKIVVIDSISLNTYTIFIKQK